MQVVIQEEEMGCGIASVANIVGLSYSEVKKKANELGIFAEDISLYSNTSYVRSLLNFYGFRSSSSEIPFSNWISLPETALLAMKRNSQFWHWAVFKKNGGDPVVLDSASCLKNNLRTDFESMDIVWFIEVSKT
jgi:ABC-type bacteriocin/lantibiotic exporter with double-glycine peptidase domain